MAIVFNGSSQYVTSTDAAIMPAAGTSFWISVWFKKASPPAAEGLIAGWAESGVDDSVFGIRMNSSGHVGSASRQNTGVGTIQLTKSFSAVNYADDNWHCVTVWFDQTALTSYTVVDQIASPTTRTLTTGQTFALGRFFAGVQIRAGVDTSLYWGGEIAEVAVGFGTLTEGEARGIYNIGIPKRTQYPASMVRRWSFQTDANAAGGSGPNLTETGSPSYNTNDDALFDAINAYTPVALTDSNAALIEEADLDSGTSHYVRVTTPSAGYIAVGNVWDLTDGVSSGQNATQWAPFLAPENRSTSNPFANKLSDYVENQFRFITVPAAGDWMFRVFQTAGSTHVLRGVSVRFDATSGNVPMFGNNFHCWPTSIYTGGSRYNISRGLDGRATLAITKDGSVVYNSDAIARTSAGDDTYHSGSALAALSTGVAVVSVGHNSDMEIAYAAGGNFTNSVTWHDVSAAGDNTYAVVTVDDDDVIHIFNRGTNDASNGYHAQRWMVTNLATSPTITVDHLGGDGTRQYPNTVYKSGDLLAYAWTGAWSYGFAAVFDVAANKWYDFAKNQMGGNSLGTIGTPRFDSTVWTTTQTAGTGLRIHGGSSSTYQAAALFDLTNWATTGAKGGFLYSETAGALNELAATTISWVVQIGATKYVSGVDFTAPADWDSNYWRVFASVQWKDNDPATNEAILFLIDHDDREAGGNYDTVLPQGYTPYYDQGGRRFRVYRITNPLSSSPTFTLLSSGVPSITNDLTAGFVRSVPGLPNTFRWEEASTELHEVKRQGKFYDWEYEEPASGGSRILRILRWLRRC